MRFIAGICTLNSRFDPGPLHVEFVVGKMALGKVLHRSLRLFPVTIIPSVLHIYISRKPQRLRRCAAGFTGRIRLVVGRVA